MLTVEEALGEVLASVKPLPPRRLALPEAAGCVLAEDVTADGDVPPFDKALVDGYALRAQDLGPTGSDRVFQVIEEILAGTTPVWPLGPRETSAVMTGAPLPAGADAVVMIESTQRRGDRVVLDPAACVAAGQNLLPRGREMRAGEVVLHRGDRLHPARLGLLATVGRSEVAVIPPPRVVIVPTGDELVEPDRELGPGQIRNSNAVMLQALARAGGAPAETTPIAPDEFGRLREILAQGLDADVLLVTGGVSAGKRDLVPEVLVRLGVGQVFHKVRLRPGKPLLFGIGPARSGGRPGALVFGLPGNPVGGLVGFLLFVRPALEALAGRGRLEPEPKPLACLANRFQHHGDRTTYHPARLRPGPGPGRVSIEPLEWAGSADLRTVAHADAFAIFPPGDRTYEAGAPVAYLALDRG